MEVFQMQNDRKVWVNYTCPSGFPGPGVELFLVGLIDGRMGLKPKTVSRRGIDS
jgi:hypothetical protein